MCIAKAKRSKGALCIAKRLASHTINLQTTLDNINVINTNNYAKNYHTHYTMSTRRIK